jgi:hypothetical protein
MIDLRILDHLWMLLDLAAPEIHGQHGLQEVA